MGLYSHGYPDGPRERHSKSLVRNLATLEKFLSLDSVERARIIDPGTDPGPYSLRPIQVELPAASAAPPYTEAKQRRFHGVQLSAQICQVGLRDCESHRSHTCGGSVKVEWTFCLLRLRRPTEKCKSRNQKNDGSRILTLLGNSPFVSLWSG